MDEIREAHSHTSSKVEDLKIYRTLSRLQQTIIHPHALLLSKMMM
jgi:hypothetical protein